MATQSDVDKAKATMDSAYAKRESFWSGSNPSGFSVMSLVTILKTCDSRNTVDRDASGNIITGTNIFGSSGCNLATFQSSVQKLIIAKSNYTSAQLAYTLAKNTYDATLKACTTCTQNSTTTPATGSTVTILGKQVNKTSLIVVVIVVVIGIGLLVAHKSGKI